MKVPGLAWVGIGWGRLGSVGDVGALRKAQGLRVGVREGPAARREQTPRLRTNARSSLDAGPLWDAVLYPGRVVAGLLDSESGRTFRLGSLHLGNSVYKGNITALPV